MARQSPLVKVVAGLAVLAIMAVLFLRSVRSTRSAPFAVERESLTGWTLVLQPRLDPLGSWLALSPPAQLVMPLGREIFRRGGESVNYLNPPLVLFLLQSEFERAFAGTALPKDIVSLAREREHAFRWAPHHRNRWTRRLCREAGRRVGHVGGARELDLGFSAGGVLTLSLRPDLPRDTPSSAREQLWMRVLERVRALPGVRAASLSVLTPLSGRNTGTVVTMPGLRPIDMRLNHVSEDYFRTFGIELLAGRAFTRHDATGAPMVAVLNETAARTAFGGRSPIGERVTFAESGVYEIVGVVDDHKHLSVREQAPPFAFVPVWQSVDPLPRLTLAISSGQPQAMLVRAVADEVRAINPTTLVSDVIGIEEQIDATLMSERLLSMLVTGFAALVLGLAAIGLYGIVSYSVACRRTEFGVRLALGAARSNVASGVVRAALLQVVAGIAVGLPLSLVTARMAERLLFGVTASDPTSFVLAAAALVGVACAAAWIPARRACSVDPAELLRRG